MCIPKILKNESNSQREALLEDTEEGCCVSQRYLKMKAIHNKQDMSEEQMPVVVYPKDT
mgnify:FL=1